MKKSRSQENNLAHLIERYQVYHIDTVPFSGLMGRHIDQSDKEFTEMKMVMLQQEETFRHQVHELHRLYRVQKLLMRDTDHARPNLELWNQEKEKDLGQRDADEETDLELTLATGSSRSSQSKKKNATLTSDSGSSFSSSSNESWSAKRSRHERAQVASTGFRNAWKNGFISFEEQIRQEAAVKQPQWLFQCSSKHDMVASFGL